jgi:hypothetical protein
MLPVFEAFLEVIFSQRVQGGLRFCLNFLQCLKSSPLKLHFHFWNKKKSQGARSGE